MDSYTGAPWVVWPSTPPANIPFPQSADLVGYYYACVCAQLNLFYHYHYHDACVCVCEVKEMLVVLHMRVCGRYYRF